jgi:hypothetical protein
MSTSVTDTPAMPAAPSRTDPSARQISPQIAAALLAKPRPELTGAQGAIVDALKAGCPGYAVMRPLMLGFRSLFRQPTSSSKNVRTTVALHRWMDRAHATGIRSLQNFVGLLRRDVLAVEAAVAAASTANVTAPSRPSLKRTRPDESQWSVGQPLRSSGPRHRRLR